MNDIKTEVAGGKAGESNPSSVIIGRSARAFEGRAGRASPVRRPAINLRELSDDMLIFMLQLMAPEKYGAYKAQPGGKVENSDQLSVNSDQSPGKSAGGGRSEMPGEAPPGVKTEGGMMKIETGNDHGKSLSSAHIDPSSGMIDRGEETAAGAADAASRRCGGGSTLPSAPPSGAAAIGTRPPSLRQTPEIPESGLASSAEATDGEKVTRVEKSICARNSRGEENSVPQDCPEFGGGGGGRGVGVKAPEGRRSPSPGGIAERRREDEHPWGLRRGVSEGDGARVGRCEIPESRGDFVPQTAGGELVMRRDCPEFPAQCASGGEEPEGPAIKSKSMIHPPQYCYGGRGKSKIGGDFEGEVGIQELREEKASAGTAAGKGGVLSLSLSLSPNHNHDLDQSGSGTPSFSAVPSRDNGRTPVIPESSRDVNSQVIDDEMVTNVKKVIYWPMARLNEGLATRNRRRREPAETEASDALTGLGDSWGRLTWACARRTRFSPGCHIAGLQPRTQSASGREGAERMGRSNQSSVIIHQSAADVSAAADPGSGGVRAERPGSSEMPESGCDFVPQTAGGELVRRQKCREIHWGKAKVRCIVSAYGGEAAEERTEVRGQRSKEIPESRCEFVPEDIGGELVMREVCPEFGTGVGTAAHQRAKVRGPRSAEIPETPESRSNFVPQTADDKSLTREDCPEFGGGDGNRGVRVKAVPMHRDRSPNPGGSMECLEKQESHWGYRRESHKADGGLAGEGRKSERLSVSGYPGREGGGTKSESRLEVFSEGTDGEIVTRVEKSICARNSRGEENSVPKNGYPLIPGAAVDVDEKGTELCHPSGEEVSFCELPWVSRGATHGCSVGIPPGCAPHETREIPESGGTDSAQNADGEIVMRDKNVKIQAAVGSQRASGSGGGKVMCPVCAGVFHDRGRIPESGENVSAQNADGENVMRVKKRICWPMAPWHEGFATRNLRGREPPPGGVTETGNPFGQPFERSRVRTRIGRANSIGRPSRPFRPPAVSPAVPRPLAWAEESWPFRPWSQA